MIFCDDCSQRVMIVPGYAAPERVCNTCFTQTNPRHVPDRTRSMSNTGGGGGGGGGGV
jgi:hypothetical protein